MTSELRSGEFKTAPISPDQVVEAKSESLPDEVFVVVNELITEKLLNGSATILQKDILARLEACGLNRSQIFEKGWLNFEELYRQAGWEVGYDKPGYNETGEAYFIFSDKTRK